MAQISAYLKEKKKEKHKHVHLNEWIKKCRFMKIVQGFQGVKQS